MPNNYYSLKVHIKIILIVNDRDTTEGSLLSSIMIMHAAASPDFVAGGVEERKQRKGN